MRLSEVNLLLGLDQGDGELGLRMGPVQKECLEAGREGW